MNFLNLFQTAVQKGVPFMNNNMASSGKDEKLRSQLMNCTYTDDTKFMIEKAVKQVFHVYPFFETDILSFKQGNQQKRFIQLKAILQIDVRGKTCKVDYNIMVPASFPKKAPYVRIINRNPDFIVDEFYRALVSPNDSKSYILNDRLNQARTWDMNKSIVNVIIESYDLLRNKFPFSKQVSQMNQYSNNNGGWGVQSPWDSLNKPKPVNQNNYQYGNQGYNNIGMNYNQPQMNKPPIPFNQNNLTQTIANGQKFVGYTRKTLQSMKNQQSKALQSVQILDVIRYSIQSQQTLLRRQNIEMNNFLSANQNNPNQQNLVNLVQANDQISQQILDLLSSVKAREDCTNQLETKFNDGNVSLDQFLKYIRKIEENKFEEKILLAKCVSFQQHH